MTAKGKAKELVDKFRHTINIADKNTNLEYHQLVDYANQCALKAVDEIIENIKEWDFTNDNSEHHYWFWQKVKEEIKQL